MRTFKFILILPALLSAAFAARQLKFETLPCLFTAIFLRPLGTTREPLKKTGLLIT
jgi:hypothetical protein